MDFKPTEQERGMIAQFIRIKFGIQESTSASIFPRKCKKAYCETLWELDRLMGRYGDDGFGDKPEHMNRVEYWLAHIE